MTELEREVKCLKAMEKSRLTEDQIDAITNFIQCKIDGLAGYIKDIEMQDMETKIVRLIKGHGHVGDRVLVPLK